MHKSVIYSVHSINSEIFNSNIKKSEKENRKLMLEVESKSL